MKVVYIQKRAGYFEIEGGLGDNFPKNNIGETWEDYLIGKWVELNEQQLDFKKNNSNISIKEVFDMELLPSPPNPPDPPEPIEEKYTWEEKQEFIEGLMDGLGL